MWCPYFLRFFAIGSLVTLACSKRVSTTVIVDPHSCEVIAGVNHESPVFPASLTKMMTLVLLFEDLEKGVIQMDTALRISRLASQQPPTKLGISPGHSITVKTCIRALALRSANDVAFVVAENLGGTQGSQGFIARMNRKAKELGLHNTFFRNPSGWHHPEQKTTSYDMAKLLCFIWKSYPQYASFLGEPFFIHNGVKKNNTNHLLGRTCGMKIGKTGYTGPAGWNLATLTQRQQGDIVVVAMGIDGRLNRDKHVSEVIETYYNRDIHDVNNLISKKHTSVYSPKNCTKKKKTSSVLAQPCAQTPRIHKIKSSRQTQAVSKKTRLSGLLKKKTLKPHPLPKRERVSCKRQVRYIRKHMIKKNKNGKNTLNFNTRS